MRRFSTILRSPIVIVGSIFIFGIVGFAAAVFNGAKIHRSFMHLNQLYKGLCAYAQDNGGELPDMTNMAAVEHALYPKYVRSHYPFFDPYTNQYYKTNPALSFKSIASLEKLPCPPVLLSSSEQPPRDQIYASGSMIQPDVCRFPSKQGED